MAMVKRLIGPINNKHVHAIMSIKHVAAIEGEEHGIIEDKVDG